MDEAVRDLLALRAVKLHPAEDAPRIQASGVWGVAERIPELGQTPGSTVQVWHVPSDILPISSAEIERWSIDAPGGRHWILSERPYDDAILDSLKSMEVVIWGPERMARWIGDAVLAGELVAHSPPFDVEPPKEQDEVVHEPDTNRTALTPVVDLESWLIQRGWEDANASPVLLSARLWTVEGILRGPEGDGEAGIWRVVEDPLGQLPLPHEPEEVLPHAPRLRVLEPHEGDGQTSGHSPRNCSNSWVGARRGSPMTKKGQSAVSCWSGGDWIPIRQSSVMLRLPSLVGLSNLREQPPRSLYGRNGRLYEAD
ncbi:MAG: hypothetical protein Ct9H300mP10_10700 [Methanobacteriota archaeon]|nr:MAG: hypothetical protein Ct9H300mP10_10700 [Euryarchaeota archaeon]